MPCSLSTLSAIRRVSLAGFATVTATLAVNACYFLVNLRLRGGPTPAASDAVQTGAPYVVLSIFLASAGAILGARLTVHWPESSNGWTDLAVGLGLALLVLGASFLRSGLDFWLPPNALMAVVGSWLGGWVARHV